MIQEIKKKILKNVLRNKFSDVARQRIHRKICLSMPCGCWYYKYFYYCGDVSKYLNNTRVPILAWILVNILPLILFSIINLLLTLRSGCLLTACTSPVLLLSGIFSHLHVGHVRYNMKNSGYVCLSKTLSVLNIFITLFGMCLHLYLITVQ